MADEAGTEEGLEDLGDPIAELRGFEELPSPGFQGRVVRSLRRRDLSSQLVTLSWTGLGQVFLELLNMVFSLFEPGASDEREER